MPNTQKRVFIIHGWGGNPEEGWLPWIKNELEKKGFFVEIPTMPNTDEPTIKEWVPHLQNSVGKSDKNTYFIGHSIGCQTIMRYFETLTDGEHTGGAIFVAGWFHLINQTDEEKEIAKPWLETPIYFEKIKKHAESFKAIFSDNDPFVPIEDAALFEKNLSAKIIVEHDKGHFSGSDEIKELPSALTAILEIAEKNN